MALNFCSFASGSSGNCYMVRSGGTVVLVDVGISGKRIFEGLEKAGAELEQIQAVLITHEHIDHVKSLPIVTKKPATQKRTPTRPPGTTLNERSQKRKRRSLPQAKIFT